jgi:response regulator NasT
MTDAKQRILVAEDDPVILFTLAEALRRFGYEVLEARRGDEALALCREHRPDLAILDVQMPGMDGIAVSERLRAETDVPFMFLSAYDERELVDRAIAAGALGYLVKPVTVAQIAPAVSAALAREIRRLREAEQTLSAALRTNRDIATAVGLIMERYGASAQEGFEALRSYARSNRVTVHSVALKVVEDPDQVPLEIKPRPGR